MTNPVTLPLPVGVTSRRIKTATGLDQHVLEAGAPGAPVLLLLHGFPELAFSWRKVMVPLAEAGFHVIAPDQRGYGHTTGWDGSFDGDLSAFAMPSLVRDVTALLEALGIEQAHAIIGHDFGSPVAAWAALLHPERFANLVCMSAPFGGPPPKPASQEDPIHQDLLALDPARKHYQWYYSTRSAAGDMLEARQGFQAFLRAYYHVKSADWSGNAPYRLDGWNATELAKMPTYYIMQANQNMAETVAPHDPGQSCDWLTEAELAVYTEQFQRTGLQGALNWYRCATAARFRQSLSAHHGRRIEVPAMFIAGAQDWGWAQAPGALEAMEAKACADWRGTQLVDGAGHWVQQEKPAEVTALILDFLRAV